MLQKLKKSEKVIIKLVQKKFFDEEYTLLLNNEEIKKLKIKGIVSISWWKWHNKSRCLAETGKDSIWMEISDYLTSQLSYYCADSKEIPQWWTSRTWVNPVKH